MFNQDVAATHCDLVIEPGMSAPRERDRTRLPTAILREVFTGIAGHRFSQARPLGADAAHVVYKTLLDAQAAGVAALRARIVSGYSKPNITITRDFDDATHWLQLSEIISRDVGR